MQPLWRCDGAARGAGWDIRRTDHLRQCGLSLCDESLQDQCPHDLVIAVLDPRRSMGHEDHAEVLTRVGPPVGPGRARPRHLANRAEAGQTAEPATHRNRQTEAMIRIPAGLLQPAHRRMGEADR